VNTAGTTFNIMQSTSDHFCFLTRVGIRETDTIGVRGVCRIVTASGYWVLQARLLGGDSNADVVCTARCYTL
jgi:hypothetical protein